MRRAVIPDGVRTGTAALSVDVALVPVGGVQFPVTGPVRYTMTGRKAVELIDIVRPRVAFPVHYEGWTHFQGAAGFCRAGARRV